MKQRVMVLVVVAAIMAVVTALSATPAFAQLLGVKPGGFCAGGGLFSVGLCGLPVPGISIA